MVHWYVVGVWEQLEKWKSWNMPGISHDCMDELWSSGLESPPSSWLGLELSSWLEEPDDAGVVGLLGVSSISSRAMQTLGLGIRGKRCWRMICRVQGLIGACWITGCCES